MATLTKNVLYCCNTFFFGFVSKHLTLYSVSNSIYSCGVCLPVSIDWNLSSLVGLKTCLFKLESSSVGMSAN